MCGNDGSVFQPGPRFLLCSPLRPQTRKVSAAWRPAAPEHLDQTNSNSATSGCPFIKEALWAGKSARALETAPTAPATVPEGGHCKGTYVPVLSWVGDLGHNPGGTSSGARGTSGLSHLLGGAGMSVGTARRHKSCALRRHSILSMPTRS